MVRRACETGKESRRRHLPADGEATGLRLGGRSLREGNAVRKDGAEQDGMPGERQMHVFRRVGEQRRDFGVLEAGEAAADAGDEEFQIGVRTRVVEEIRDVAMNDTERKRVDIAARRLRLGRDRVGAAGWTDADAVAGGIVLVSLARGACAVTAKEIRSEHEDFSGGHGAFRGCREDRGSARMNYARSTGAPGSGLQCVTIVASAERSSRSRHSSPSSS